METNSAIRKRVVALGIVAAIAGVFGARSAFAATLSFAPSSGTYFSGRSFTVAVQVSSPDQAMNAVQGEISFPANELQVLSISKTNSVLNLWVQGPTFSNQDGTVNFAGVVVNPGYQGTAATVIDITFEAKGTGNAPISFVSGSVLANDGQGTNILTAMGSAALTIAPLAGGGLPSNGSFPATTPSIFIVTTPPVVSGTWYNLGQVTFDWSVPVDADGVDYDIFNNPGEQLPDVDKGLISQTSYDFSAFRDGPWYFEVSFESGDTWSTPVVKKILLDRTAPDPFIITRVDQDQADVQPVFQWNAADEGSGISHYEVKIGGGDWFDASDIEIADSTYLLPAQSPTGGRTVTVRAFDNAGNYRDASVTFSVLRPGASCSGTAFSCRVSNFFAAWGWLIALIFVLFLAAAYGFIYGLFRWKKRVRQQLAYFERKLEEDVAGLEQSGSRQSGLGNETVKIVEQVKEEIEDIEKEK